MGRQQGGGIQRRVVSQHDSVAVPVLFQHIYVPPHRHAKALSLADGIAGQAPVPSQHAARFVQEVSRRQCQPLPLQKGHIVSVRHEADVLAVALVGVVQPGLPRLVTDSRLVIVSHWQQQMGQLVLRQLIQHIALVLPPFRTPQQAVSAAFRVIGHPGVVPRGDIVVAKRQCPVQQGAEFQLPVTVDARIGRPSGRVFRRKPVHYAPAEAVCLVEYIEPHP